jgi:hypothetical protein
MDVQQIERMRHLWKDARSKYLSFFTCLEQVRQEIGDEALEEWCRRELLIGLTIINKVTGVLRDVDEEKTKRDLKAATQAAAGKARREKEEAARKREIEKAEHDARVAAIRAKEEEDKKRRAVEVAERKRVDAQSKRREDKQNKPHERGSKAASHKRRREATAGIAESELSECAAGIGNGVKLCKKGWDHWVEGSIAQIEWLKRARDLLPADQDFGVWCDGNIPLIGKNDRAALIGLGRFMKFGKDGKPARGGRDDLRAILEATESRSYRLIWESCRIRLHNTETAETN